MAAPGGEPTGGAQHRRAAADVESQGFLVGGGADRQLAAALAGQIGVFVGQNVDHGFTALDLVAKIRKQVDWDQ